MILETMCLGELFTNCYVASGDGEKCVLVDPACDAEIICKKIKSLGLTLSAILLTHGHFDHISAINEIMDLLQESIPVYIHTNDYEYLINPEYNLSAYYSEETFIYNGNNVKKVNDGEKIDVAGLEFTVIHTPGHTPGSVIYKEKEIMFSGDTVFYLSIGRTDFPGSNPAQMRETLNMLSKIKEDYTLYPGHGGKTSLDYEKKYNEYFDAYFGL